MKLLLKRIAAVSVLISIFVLGTAFIPKYPAPSVAQPNVIMRVLDPSLEGYSQMWQREVGRRFSNAVVILVHGGDFVEGQWIVGDWQYRNGPHVRPIKDAVMEAQKMYPGRTVVLLACNTGHLTLGIPGVYYAKSSVWCVPDRAVAEVDPSLMFLTLDVYRPVLDRWHDDPDVVGNIFEFVSD